MKTNYPDLPHVLVCGGREFADYLLLVKKLDKITADLGKLVVVHGAAAGADTLADKWVQERGHTVVRFHADWEKHGKAAGPLRNQEMLDFILTAQQRFAVCCWDGESRGTKDMIRKLAGAGIETRIIRYRVNA